MNELETVLTKKYGNTLIPVVEIKKILHQSAEKYHINESDISQQIDPMTPRQLINYIDHLKRKFLFEGNIFMELSKPNISEYNPDDFHSFNETINELKDKNRVIQERWNTSKINEEIDFGEILKKFIKYEKKQIMEECVNNKNDGKKLIYCVVFIVICVIYYLSLERPY